MREENRAETYETGHQDYIKNNLDFDSDVFNGEEIPEEIPNYNGTTTTPRNGGNVYNWIMSQADPTEANPANRRGIYGRGLKLNDNDPLNDRMHDIPQAIATMMRLTGIIDPEQELDTETMNKLVYPSSHFASTVGYGDNNNLTHVFNNNHHALNRNESVQEINRIIRGEQLTKKEQGRSFQENVYAAVQGAMRRSHHGNYQMEEGLVREMMLDDDDREMHNDNGIFDDMLFGRDDEELTPEGYVDENEDLFTPEEIARNHQDGMDGITTYFDDYTSNLYDNEFDGDHVYEDELVNQDDVEQARDDMMDVGYGEYGGLQEFEHAMERIRQDRYDDAYDRDQEESNDRRDDDDEDSDYVNDRNHPRNLWNAESPDEAPRSADATPIQKARDAALGRFQVATRQAADAMRGQVENLPPEQRDKIMQNPIAQQEYERLRNLNVGRNTPANPDAEGDDRWEGSDDRRFADDFTSFGLEFHNNPNRYMTSDIDSLDDDLDNAGLSRGDLKRAVYIAWSALSTGPAKEKMLKKFRKRYGADTDDIHPDYAQFSKKMTGLNARTNWKKNVLPALQKGDILYNTPIGGPNGERALLYSMMGFGQDGMQGQQAVVGEGGKVFPLNPSSDRQKEIQRDARQRSIGRRRDRIQGAQNPTPPGADGTPQRPVAPNTAGDMGSSEQRETAVQRLAGYDTANPNVSDEVRMQAAVAFINDMAGTDYTPENLPTNLRNAIPARAQQQPEPATQQQEPAPNTPTRSFPDVEELISGADLNTTQGAQAAAEALGRLIGGDDEAITRARNAFSTWWLSPRGGGRGGPTANWLRDYAHRTRPVNESYITEEMDEELQFFSQMFPDLEPEEVMEILQIMMQFQDQPEREPDGIDAARNNAFAKLNSKKIDIDD